MTIAPPDTTGAATGLHPVAAAVNQIKGELQRQFLERDELTEAAWLAILAKEHCFILGPPGTGKSMFTRECIDRIEGANYFEAILSKNRPPEAVLGPYDIPELRDNGHLYRKWNGYLPWAHYAMLDEIGKMSPTMGHDLLPVLLERRLHQVNGGLAYIDLDLRTVMGGSNELPTAEDDDAAALWDRMLVRTVVDNIQEDGNFAHLMAHGAPRPANPTRIPHMDLALAADTIVPQVSLPQDVLEAMVQLRNVLRTKEKIVVSTRRWDQSKKLIKANAFLEGRTVAIVDDLYVLKYALWDTPEQRDKIERLTLGISNPLAEEALKLEKKATELVHELNQIDPQMAAKDKAATAVELGSRARQLVGEVDGLMQKARQKGSSTARIEKVLDKVRGVQKTIHHDLLGLI